MDASFLENGWSGFDSIEQKGAPDDKERAKQIQEAEAAEIEDKCSSVARCFRGANGKKALDYLRSRTVELPCFDPAVQGENAMYSGFFREGQNSVIRLIEALIQREQAKEVK